MSARPLVVLDPGHGGDDPGAIAFGVEEKTLTFELASRVRALLDGDLDVTLTREGDTSIAPVARAESAARLGADFLLSLHVNACDGVMSGFESYVADRDGDDGTRSRVLQHIVHRELTGLLAPYGVLDRGQRRAGFKILVQPGLPAVLLELLFIDNPGDHKLLADPGFRERLAQRCASAIAIAAPLML
jgi:N-acetylmuramoyl-L-alanine amidase